MKYKAGILIYIFLLSSCFQSNLINQRKHKWSDSVENMLISLGDNRVKYEALLEYYSAPEDTLKFKAACFLISNLNYHTSRDRIWLNEETKERLKFDELDYCCFKHSLHAFNDLKDSVKVSAVPFMYCDADTLSVDYLKKNIDNAFSIKSKPWCQNLSFDLFCEYILPYRISTEPVQDWRSTYQSKNDWLIKDYKPGMLNEALCTLLNDSIRRSFKFTYGIIKRKEPLPLLGAMSLELRKQGECGDVVNYTTFCMRSIGLPSAVDFVPHWGTSGGRHFWNVLINECGEGQMFMGGGSSLGEYKINKEMPKIYRFMFSRQKDAIGSKVAKHNIPDALLKSSSIKDVTDQYVKTSNLSIELKDQPVGSPIFFCVWNNSKWRPVAGEILNNNHKVTFSNMGRGIVYVAMMFDGNQMIPVSNPIKISKDGNVTNLKIDKDKTRDIVMTEEDQYLIFRMNKKYRFYYWDSEWKLSQTKSYQKNKKIKFEALPVNTIYLMVPEYSWGKERIFTYENGERFWW